MASRAVDEDPPHQLRRHREEMRTILPVHTLVIDKAQICLVDELGGLQAVAAALPAHVASREPMQLVIDNGRQSIQGFVIATAPGLQQRADVLASRSSRLHFPFVWSTRTQDSRIIAM